MLGTHLEPDNQWEPISANLNVGEGTNVEAPQSNILNRIVRSTVGDYVDSTPETLAQATSQSSLLAKLQNLPGLVKDSFDSSAENAETSTSTLSSILSVFSSSSTSTSSTAAPTTTSTEATSTAASILGNIFKTTDSPIESFDSLIPAALTAIAGDASITVNTTMNGTSCNRTNIMGTIVNDSAPYLYPFVIEYSLIGAVVIYVIWRQIGRFPK